MSDAKRFVYVIESESRPACHYVGLSSNVADRVEAHNAGRSPHTARNRPWRLIATVEFHDEAKAIAFEKYLKSGTGRAFLRARIL
jgi:putative endonuclease